MDDNTLMFWFMVFVAFMTVVIVFSFTDSWPWQRKK
jgi:hypothetical protein